MARSIWERYKHYNPVEEGYGSAAEWAELADAMADRVMGGFTADMAKPVRKARKGQKDPDLETLMLDKLPDSLDKLKTAYRNSMLIYHPDVGGTHEQAIAARESYERLLIAFVKRSKRNAAKG